MLAVKDQSTASVEHDNPGRTWELLRLRGRIPQTELCESSRPVRVVDLCCGPGGFATGFRRACQAVGVRCAIAAAVDISSQALAVYRLNLRPRQLVAEHVANLVDFEDGDGASIPVVSSELRTLAADADVVLAGPPCEGNSNLNNRTRRVDRRNELYLSCVALAIGVMARVVIVENVVQVTKAKQKVVPRATRMLRRFGYQIVADDLVLDAAEFGTAQSRRRHFLVATRSSRQIDTASFAGLKINLFRSWTPSAT